jgi:hypothetical protein
MSALSPAAIGTVTIHAKIMFLRGKQNQLWGFVRSEALTAVVMKSIIFWDITPCSPVRVNWRFGGTYRLHLQGRRISRASRALLVTCVHAALLPVDFQRTTRLYIPENGTLIMRPVRGLSWMKEHKLFKTVPIWAMGQAPHSLGYCWNRRTTEHGSMGFVTTTHTFTVIPCWRMGRE